MAATSFRYAGRRVHAARIARAAPDREPTVTRSIAPSPEHIARDILVLRVIGHCSMPSSPHCTASRPSASMSRLSATPSGSRAISCFN